jgi:hypothetical protein
MPRVLEETVSPTDSESEADPPTFRTSRSRQKNCNLPKKCNYKRKNKIQYIVLYKIFKT